MSDEDSGAWGVMEKATRLGIQVQPRTAVDSEEAGEEKEEKEEQQSRPQSPSKRVTLAPLPEISSRRQAAALKR